VRNKNDTLDNFKVFVTEIENNSIRKSSDLILIKAQNNFHTSMSFMNDTIIHETTLDMNGKAVIKNILFTESVVVIMLNSGSASHCWEKFNQLFDLC